MFFNDETMDEIAQFQHDTMWESPEAIEEEVIREGDLFDCIHENGMWEDHFTPRAVYGTFTCSDCDYTKEVR